MVGRFKVWRGGPSLKFGMVGRFRAWRGGPSLKFGVVGREFGVVGPV